MVRSSPCTEKPNWSIMAGSPMGLPIIRLSETVNSPWSCLSFNQYGPEQFFCGLTCLEPLIIRPTFFCSEAEHVESNDKSDECIDLSCTSTPERLTTSNVA